MTAPTTPQEYTEAIRKLRIGVDHTKGRERTVVELAINALQTEAAFNVVDLVLSGRPEDEQAIIDWARASCGLEVG